MRLAPAPGNACFETPIDPTTGMESPMRRTTVIAEVPVRFSVDPEAAPPNGPIHDALRALRTLEIEAPTLEVAELYAQLLVDALERAGNSPPPPCRCPAIRPILRVPPSRRARYTVTWH